MKLKEGIYYNAKFDSIVEITAVLKISKGGYYLAHISPRKICNTCKTINSGKSRPLKILNYFIWVYPYPLEEK